MSEQLRSIIVEGVDRLGKTSLIAGLQQHLGGFQVLHYEKPILLDKHINDAKSRLNRNEVDADVKREALKSYQINSFSTMFHALSSGGRFIMDRAHLGEAVYGPRYRQYDGSYVYDLERSFINDRGSKFHETTLLVFLHTSDFSFIQDDGDSFDFSKKDEEQNDFMRAFDRSEIIHKVAIDVSDDAGGFADSNAILSTVVKAFNEFTFMPHPCWAAGFSRIDGVLNRGDHFYPDPKKVIV